MESFPHERNPIQNRSAAKLFLSVRIEHGKKPRHVYYMRVLQLRFNNYF